MHTDLSAISKAAARARELGLGEAASAKFIDQYAEGHALGAAEVRAHARAVMALPEAKDRPAAALRLALSAEQISPDEAATKLASMPTETATRANVPTLAERAGGEEIGPCAPPVSRDEAKKAVIASVWSRVVGQLNAER